MISTQRPGVFSSYEVTSSISGAGNGGVVGVVAETGEGFDAGVCRIGSYASAVSTFGKQCGLAELVRLLFLNGATGIVAAPVAAGASTADYSAAFEALKADETIKLLVCDSRSGAVHAAMKESILSAHEGSKYRVGIVEVSGTVNDMTTAAAALNCERMVVLPGESAGDKYGSVAAALAGVVAGGRDPALPLNGAELLGLTDFNARFSDAEITWLVEGGVTPVENVMGAAYVVRGITTRVKTEGEADATWRELTTTLIMDDVITTVRGSLRSRFSRTKNNAQTRGAIRTQVVIDLEGKKAREIIDSYGKVMAEASSADPTVCEVSFEFAVAHGLNQIHLMAHITV